MKVLHILSIAALVSFLPGSAWSQEPDEKEEGHAPKTLEVTPQELTLKVGEKATLTAVVKDDEGAVLERKVIFYSRARRDAGVNPAGEVSAYRPGEHTIVALVPKDPKDTSRRPEPLIRIEVTVTIPQPPIEKVTLVGLPGAFYAGTVVPIKVDVRDTIETQRLDVEVSFASRNPDIVEIDSVGNVTPKKPGKAVLEARAEGIEGSVEIEVVEDPVVAFSLEASVETARTGDVVHFEAVAKDADGKTVPHYPVRYAAYGEAYDTIVEAGAISHVYPDGAFVAERSGLHTVVAIAGPHSAQKTIRVTPRNVRQNVEVVGHGPVRDRHTSDLWIWEGADGCDYAITGTWGASGHAYIWDVSEPKNMQIIDVVKLDARTVNDVKISEDGKTAVLSREGASSRKNGIVILDVSAPRDGVRIIGRFDDQLHGGVHNVFIHKDHVFAVNNGRRFDIINIEDPSAPSRVGRFELTTPGHGIHDVWVEDGIAYTSNWHDGVVAIDVGNGVKGGSPNKPVEIGSYAWPNGWNHAAYPYTSTSTGKRYIFGGDEAFPYSGINPAPGSPPDRAAGWIHIVQVDDWDDAKEVARYYVPEAGSHNLWVEDDILYIGYYNGGLRVVDVSGELRGDLYKQGREIAFWHPYDPKGYIPNAPFVWGPQPYKGNVFMADFNSGLWAVKLTPFDEEEKPIDLGEPQ